MFENEKVLVVETRKLEEFVGFREGIVKVDISDVEKFIRKEGFFVDREKAEYDEKMRQVIPYMALRDEDGYLVFKRLGTQGEKRLHNLYTVGIGGHIRLEDMLDDDPWKAVQNGMMRELREEVDVEILAEPIFVGLLNDRKKEVSRVHVGLCYILNVKFKGLNEPDKFEYFRVKELGELEKMNVIGRMESWSNIFINILKTINAFS